MRSNGLGFVFGVTAGANEGYATVGGGISRWSRGRVVHRGWRNNEVSLVWYLVFEKGWLEMVKMVDGARTRRMTRVLSKENGGRARRSLQVQDEALSFYNHCYDKMV
ncbi:hypothetical protein QVD17_16562 [Tagetes erecta]|uniref:Uncharacterized protein n=1 Tax=Tagetes erecta TaxID=13708 RepID=A0AAD8NMR0_TARER|nr:hypothetical protein QVD17_30106 [Tagetes erecta]KAK1414364.1 hypothetical protein QVD17_30108 [Tagetes erecta]KAK1427862.1 hypothetical protein QVD17_16560 [Tagetes erecta]KAK1427864.1 hypothetical protein QVD17_16562 [Tagetes erecta]